MHHHRFHPHMLTFVIVLVVSTSFAWDGKRKGFLLGIGTGLGMTMTNVRAVSSIPLITEPDSIDGTLAGLGVNFKIGYARNNQFQLYYSQMSNSLFPLLVAFGDRYGEALKMKHLSDIAIVFFGPFIMPFVTSHVFGGLGFTYHLSPAETGFFLNGGLGTSIFQGVGVGISAGGGYEFKRHMNVALDFFWGSGRRDPHYLPPRSNTGTIMCTVNVLGY